MGCRMGTRRRFPKGPRKDSLNRVEEALSDGLEKRLGQLEGLPRVIDTDKYGIDDCPGKHKLSRVLCDFELKTRAITRIILSSSKSAPKTS